MKTIIKSTALVLGFALLSTVTFAQDTIKKETTTTNEVSAIVNYDDSVIDLNIENASAGESTVMIYDAAGNLLLTDVFANEGTDIKKSYALDDDTLGDYVIKVSVAEASGKK